MVLEFSLQTEFHIDSVLWGNWEPRMLLFTEVSCHSRWYQGPRASYMPDTNSTTELRCGVGGWSGAMHSNVNYVAPGGLLAIFYEQTLTYPQMLFVTVPKKLFLTGWIKGLHLGRAEERGRAKVWRLWGQKGLEGDRYRKRKKEQSHHWTSKESRGLGGGTLKLHMEKSVPDGKHKHYFGIMEGK